MTRLGLAGMMLLAASLLPAAAALAQGEPTARPTPRELGTFSDWVAFELIEGETRTCYMAATPRKDEGDYRARDPIYAMIIHRPGEKIRDEFMYQAGYTYEGGSNAVLRVDGGDRFELVTDEGLAYVRDLATERRLIEAVRKGSEMVVTGTSSRGTRTRDTFSLAGSGKAYEAISKACGYE